MSPFGRSDIFYNVKAKQNRATSATYAYNSLTVNADAWCKMAKNRVTILHLSRYLEHLSRYLWTFDAARIWHEDEHCLSWEASLRVEKMPSTTVGNAFYD